MGGAPERRWQVARMGQRAKPAGFNPVEGLGSERHAPFSGGPIMTRHVFFAIALIGTGVLLNSPSEAQKWRCEDRAANCLGTCTDRAAGISDWGRLDKCWRCDRQVIKCMINANMRRYSYY